MKVFYHIWAWRPSWSCDPDAANKISFPLPKEAPHKIWPRSAKRFLRRRCLSIVDDDGRRRRTPDLGYTMSSPMSLRLKIFNLLQDYLRILACSQVKIVALLGYLFFTIIKACTKSRNCFILNRSIVVDL